MDDIVLDHVLDGVRGPVTTMGVGSTSVLKLNLIKEISNVAKTCEIRFLIKFFPQRLEPIDKVIRAVKGPIRG